MFSILKKPFPCIYGQKENFITALLVGIFVSAFLLIFKPFGIEDQAPSDEYFHYKAAGFGVVTFIVALFTYYVPVRIFPKFFEEKNYTLGKDIFMAAVLILLIGIGNSIYAQLCAVPEDHFNYLTMIWQTFLVGIFPLTVLSLLQYNRLLTQNTKTSAEINSHHESFSSQQLEVRSPRYYSISSEQGKVELDLNDILFLESDGNYAHLHQFQEGQYSKSMYRTTLKSLESDNAYPNIKRCHRSYIVNLDQVKAVSGNAQGLKLALHNCDELVPVSRKYIGDVKEFFNQQ